MPPKCLQSERLRSANPGSNVHCSTGAPEFGLHNRCWNGSIAMSGINHLGALLGANSSKAIGMKCYSARQ
eukprot:scaffold155787_cov29-Tisochrysis_lutea.AAC.2